MALARIAGVSAVQTAPGHSPPLLPPLTERGTIVLTTLAALVQAALALFAPIAPAAGPAHAACARMYTTGQFLPGDRELVGAEDSAAVDACFRTGTLIR